MLSDGSGSSPHMIPMLFFVIIASTPWAFLPVSSRALSYERILQNELAPSNGCGYGLWNKDSRKCDCIPPFCRGQNGECQGGSCGGGNPWDGCEKGKNCPWWINGPQNEKCTTGNEIPAGIWSVFNSEEACCLEHRPDSKICNQSTTTGKPADSPATELQSDPQIDDLFEVVPVKFSVDGLPDVVDIRELKDEMFIIIKRVLIDLTERTSSLRIKSVEEKLHGAENNIPAGKLDVSYDVTVVRQKGKQFGPIIIQWMQDSYDHIVDQIKEYINVKYIGYDVTWNVGKTELGQFHIVLPVEAEEVTPIEEKEVTPVDNVIPIKTRFKVDDVAKENVLMEGLAQKLLEIYKDTLAKVDGLNITLFEVTDIVNLPGGYVDVVLEIHVQNYREDIGAVVGQTIQELQEDVLGQIQSSSDSGLIWCIDQDGVFATCDVEEDAITVRVTPDPPKTLHGLPRWAIILSIAAIAALGLLLCCGVYCCIISLIRQQDEEKNDIHMVTYISTGGLNSQKRSAAHKRRPRRPQSPPHYIQPSTRPKEQSNRPSRNSRRNSQVTAKTSRKASRDSDEGQLLALEAANAGGSTDGFGAERIHYLELEDGVLNRPASGQLVQYGEDPGGEHINNLDDEENRQW